ncbi:HD domain-containing protein [Eubacteriaceae bacterium ES3]|nr:HD domain-containing protein [Eubacteriaceae bacterium ES3]
MYRKCCEISLLFNRIEGSQEAVFPDCFRETIERIVLELLFEPFSNLINYQKFSMNINCLAGHSLRTALIAGGIGQNLQLDLQDRIELGIGAILHDIGKIRIDGKILNKPSKLSDEEYEKVKAHPQIGCQLLKNQTWIPANSLNMIRNHHERLDGSGYPDHKRAADLLLFDRIIAVSDVFDAMTCRRNYRQAFSLEEAYQVLMSEVSEHFDGRIVETLGDMMVNEGVRIDPVRKTYVLANGKGA